MGEMTSAELQEFGPFSIYPEDIPNIQMRLSMMPKRRQADQSVYLVFAYPENAKIRRVRDGGNVVSVWPESCIGMIAQVGEVHGSIKSWDVYPVLRSSAGWRKIPVRRVEGRADAALELLTWLTNANWTKAKPAEKRAWRKRRKVQTDPELHAMAVLTFDAYMKTYDNFSSDSREVGEALGVNNNTALHIGKVLENAELIVIEPFIQQVGMRVSGRGIGKSRGSRGRYEPDTWQCLDTYDTIDRLQAIDKFVEKCPDLAEVAKKYIADTMRETREQKIDVYHRIK